MRERWRTRHAGRTRGAALVAVLAMVGAVGAVSCSSSSGKATTGSPAGSSGANSPSAGGGGGGGGKTITVGVIADITGLAASSSKSAIQGINAGVIYAKSQGYTIKYIVTDTATNPPDSALGGTEAGDA